MCFVRSLFDDFADAEGEGRGRPPRGALSSTPYIVDLSIPRAQPLEQLWERNCDCFYLDTPRSQSLWTVLRSNVALCYASLAKRTGTKPTWTQGCDATASRLILCVGSL